MNCMRTKHLRTRKHKPLPITLFSYWKNRSAIFSPASPSLIPLKTLNWSIFYIQDKHWLRSLNVTTFPKSVASFPCTETFDNTNLLRKLQAESSLLPFLQKAEGTKLRSGYMFISERELGLAYTSKRSADTDAVICDTESFLQWLSRAGKSADSFPDKRPCVYYFFMLNPGTCNLVIIVQGAESTWLRTA